MVGPSKQSSNQANIHTHVRNEVTLVWGSLRLAPIISHLVLYQNVKIVLVQLVYLINAHQNDIQKPIGSVPTYHVQYTLPPQPIYQTLLSIFEGLVPRLLPSPLLITLCILSTVNQTLSSNSSHGLCTRQMTVI